jgi:ArsR family transcriptional regulator
MDEENVLKQMETFFLAMADKTRLRLINLMRSEEICVCFFTEVLGESQPKISRHLAYLRNAGVVEARREGKWMHYSIRRPSDADAARVMDEILSWLDSREELRLDRRKYETVCCSPEMLVQIARTPMPFLGTEEEPDVVEEYSVAGNAEVVSAHNELEDYLL